MSAPRQMTERTLNALKGWPQPAAVDYTAEFDSSITAEVPPGACVHLNPSGKFALGVGALDVMPLFTFNGSRDPDVVNEAPDPATTKGAYVPINPTGQAMALVANGAYELVSTHFVTASAASFVPNALLTSPLTGDDAGRLDIGEKYVDTIVGIVSRGVTDNGWGYDAVAFWPHVILPTPT